MQKDREIADFEAKMKKSQFKHNRQLKQVKMSQERLQRLLRDQKAKNEKLSNQLRDIQEQYRITKIKFTQYKEDKDKQIIDIYNKYGVLKEEVRSYERVLPTFTFLLQIDKSINQIPVYEDIYINLNQKSLEVAQLNQRLQSSRVQWQQVIKNIKMNEQLLKSKKIEAQKGMKEMLSKVYEYEQQVYELKCQNENLHNIIMQTNEQLQLSKQRGQSLQQSLKEYELKIQSLVQNFQTLLKNKEQQIHTLNNQQKQQLQQKLQYDLIQFQKKQNLYLQQINSFQQQIIFLNNKYREELSTFQEHYINLKQQTELMKKQINNQKKRYDQLQQKYYENVQNLTKVSLINHQNQQKIINLQNIVSNYQSQLKQIIKIRQCQSNQKLKKIQHEYEMIQSKYLKLNQSLKQIIEQKDVLQHQNIILRQQIDHRQQQLKNISSNLLDIPNNITQFHQFIRRKSLSITQNKQEEDNMQKIIILQPQNTANNCRNSQHQQKIGHHSHVQPIISDNLSQIKIIKLQKQLKEQTIKYQHLKQTNQLLSSQLSTIKQKNIILTRQLNDYETSSSKSLLSIYKLKLKTIQQQLTQSKQDINKLKQQNNKLKNKYKQQNDNLKLQINNYKKQIKQLLKQIQNKQKQYKKNINQYKIKDNGIQHQLLNLKMFRQNQNNRKKQIQMYKDDVNKLQSKIKQLEKASLIIKQENYLQKQNIVKFQQQLKVKNRQIERINESLFRERKERSMLTAPSLPSLQFIQNQQISQQQEPNNAFYKKIAQQQDAITKLQRELSDLKQQKYFECETKKSSIEQLQKENKYYVQTIIEMKMKCAQSEMRAHQKEYLYVQLKKKLKI